MLVRLSPWPVMAPLIGWAVLLLLPGSGAFQSSVIALALAGSVLAAVHHAEIVAHRVGEPLGTFLLAVAVTVIEVGLIVSMMLAAGEHAATLARDTVFAAVMIILNGLIGICILAGAVRHREQIFRQAGVSAALAAIATLTVLTLVLPNYTTSVRGPVYSPAQLAFVALVSLLLYGTFVLVQTVRHRDYFLPKGEAAFDESAHVEPPSRRTAIGALFLLLACLGAVVLLAKSLAPTIDSVVAAMGAPQALVGVVIATLVLLPEGFAAFRAARANRLQTSLNLGLGSALATIGLTIPAVAALSLFAELPIALGLGPRSMVLLVLTLVVATLSLGTARTTILQGMVHLAIFAVYLFTTIVP